MNTQSAVFAGCLARVMSSGDSVSTASTAARNVSGAVVATFRPKSPAAADQANRYTHLQLIKE